MADTQQTDRKIWSNFSGGLADSELSGVENSFFKLFGLNIHDKPGTITVNQKLTLNSGSTVTEFCRVSVSVSNGEQYWFSYTSGKIWRRISAGTWDLVYTTSPAAGAAGCLGACEYNGFLYWATQSRLHRIAITGLGAAAQWTANAAPNWQTFTLTDANYHPMVVQNNSLFIGDSAQVSSVSSASAFTAAALTIETPHRVRCMALYDIDLIIGTTISANVNYSKVYRWDTIQTTWQYSEPLDENSVNAFFYIGNALCSQAGTSGKIYAYDGNYMQPTNFRIPGTFNNTQFAEVYPSAVGIWNGRTIFGLSNSQDTTNTTGNPADMGIYSIGSYDEKYPKVLCGVEFPISTGTITGVEIGAILVERNTIYVSWKDGASFGVDALDFTAKQTSAYLETTTIIPDSDQETTFNKFMAGVYSLPASTSLLFKYYKNFGSVTTLTNPVINDTTDPQNAQIYVEEGVDARAIRMRIEFTVNGNNAPILDYVGLIWSN